jgi:hypothetical protein
MQARAPLSPLSPNRTRATPSTGGKESARTTKPIMKSSTVKSPKKTPTKQSVKIKSAVVIHHDKSEEKKQQQQIPPQAGTDKENVCETNVLTPSRFLTKAVGTPGAVTPMNRTPKEEMQNKQQNSSDSGSGSHTYEYEFPSGPMGLELEPVIISASKQIGCRVKDFYFSIDFPLNQQKRLKSHVHVGDVMSSLNGNSVLSNSFQDILDKLRKMKDESRTVIFKNLTIRDENTSVNTVLTPAKHQSQSQTPAKLLRGMLAASGPTSISTSVSTPAKSKTKEISESPATWKVHSGVKAPKQQQLTISPKAIKALRYDSAADDMASYYYHSQSPDPRAKNIDNNDNNKSTTPICHPAPQSDLNRVLSTMGDAILGGLTGIVGNKILGGAAENFSSVSNHEDQTPQEQINALINMKHELVTELSKSCVLLGVAEDKNIDLIEQYDTMKSETITLKKNNLLLENKTFLLNDEITDVQMKLYNMTNNYEHMLKENEILNIKFIKQNEENFNYTNELLNYKNKINIEEKSRLDLKNKYDSLHTLHVELQQNSIKEKENHIKELQNIKEQLHEANKEIILSKERVTILECERDSETESWKVEMEAMVLESSTLRTEMEQAFQAAAASLEAAELRRDELQTEVDVLKDIGNLDLSVKVEEIVRLKEQILHLSSDHSRAVSESTNEMEAIVKEMNDDKIKYQNMLDESKKTVTEHVNRIEELEKLNQTAMQATDVKYSQIVELENFLMESDKTIIFIKEEFSEKLNLSNKLNDQLKAKHIENEVLIDNLNKDIKELEENFTNKQMEYSTKSLAQCNEMEQLREALLQSSDLVVNLKSSLDDTTLANKSSVDYIVKSFENDKILYNSKIHGLQKNIDDLQENIILLQTKVATSEASVYEQLQSNEETQAKLNKEMLKNQEMNEHIVHLQEDMTHNKENNQSQLSDANQRILDSMTEINKLQAELHSEKTQYLDSLSNKNEEINNIENHCQSLKEEILSLEGELETSQFAYETMKVTYNEYVKESQENEALIHDQLTSIRKELVLSQEHVNELQSSLNDTISEKNVIIEIAETEQAESRMVANQLEEKLNKLYQTFQLTKTELNSMKVELVDLTDASNAINNEYEAEMVKLTKELSMKFEYQLKIVGEKMLKQKDDFKNCEEEYQMKLEILENEKETTEKKFLDITKSGEIQLNHTYTRAKETEKLLQDAYDEHTELNKTNEQNLIIINELSDKISLLKNEIVLKEEININIENKIQNEKNEKNEIQTTLMHLRESYDNVCNEFKDLLKKNETEVPKLQEHLANTKKELNVIINERNELSQNCEQMAKSHADITCEVHGLLASQEEMMAEFDTERSNYLESSTRAEEHYQMMAESQLSNQLSIFENKLIEVSERYENDLKNDKEAFLKKLEILESKLYEKQNQLTARNKELTEYKKSVVPVLRSELELFNEKTNNLLNDNKKLELQVAKSSADLYDSISKHTQELCSTTEEFGERENSLLRQRDELMTSLKTQHEQLSATIDDKETHILELKDEIQDLQLYISGQKDARKQENEEATLKVSEDKNQIELLTKELANMHANINRMIHKSSAMNNAGTGTGMEGLTSKDLISRLEDTLVETKALLATAVKEKNSLQAANNDLLLTTQEQMETITTTSKQFKSHEAYVREQEKMQIQQQILIVDYERRCRDNDENFDRMVAEKVAEAGEAIQHRHAAIVADKEVMLSEISSVLGESKTEGIRMRQEILNLKAQVVALREQCAELTANSSINSQNRDPLREVQASTDEVESSISDDNIDLVSAATNYFGDTNVWHDQLVMLTLDLHESLTFAIVQQTMAHSVAGASAVSDNKSIEMESAIANVSTCLKAASINTQAIHSHVLSAPWAQENGPAPALPPAHDMLNALTGASSASIESENEEKEQDENIAPSTSTLCSNVSYPSSMTNGDYRSVVSSSSDNTDSFLVTQLMKRLDETNKRCNVQEVALWKAKSTMNHMQRNDYDSTSQSDAVGAGVSTVTNSNYTSSEQVYLLLEDLVEILGPVSVGNSANSPNSSYADTGDSSFVSLSYESDRALWNSLKSVAINALDNYKNRCFSRATSEGDRRNEQNFTAINQIKSTHSQSQPHHKASKEKSVERLEHGDNVLSSSISSALSKMNQQHQYSIVEKKSDNSNNQNSVRVADLSLDDIVALTEDSFESNRDIADGDMEANYENLVPSHVHVAGATGHDDSGFWNLSADNINHTLDSSIDSIGMETHGLNTN